MIHKILKNWNIEGELTQIYHSAWSVNDTYVIKEYADESQLKRNITMFKTLVKEQMLVPAVIPLPNGEAYYKHKDKLYLLTTHLQGKNNVDLNQQDDEWLFDFGKIIGQLHQAFQVCQKEISFWNNSLLEEMTGWVKSDLDKYKLSTLQLEDADEAIHQLSEVYHQLPTQLIHRDIHLGNFLFDEDQFVGYIDFDLSQSNIRIFDLCYFLLGILSAANNHTVIIDTWLNLVKNVVNGYDSTNPLKQVEKEAIPCVMQNIELLFAAYFAGLDNETMTEDAVKLFYLVKEHEESILDVLGCT